MGGMDYDLAIVGAGASGLIAADFAVRLGARTALIDKGPIGGDCTWNGCVPSKSLVKVAAVAHQVRTAQRYGISAGEPQVDMPSVRDYLRATIQQIYAPTAPEALRKPGLEIFIGAARFLDPHTVQVASERVRARKFLINTGAAPKIPEISGLAEVPYRTYLQIFENDRLPRHLLVVGGGPLGCELAQAYRRLGAEVTILAERLLPREEPEAREVLERVFAQEGIRRIPARVLRANRTGEVIRVLTANHACEGDLLLIATGRTPLVQGLALDAARVRYSADGIWVNKHLQTTASHIYAAGDVLGGAQYSHLAGWQGFQAVRNALLPGNNAGESPAMSRITFTAPEVAQAGLTEAAARLQYPPGQLRVEALDLSKVDRAVSEDDPRGFIKLITEGGGRIVGATFVGQRAGEAITEIAVAIRNRLKLGDLAATIHPYPTYSTGIQLLATKMAVDQATSGIQGKLIRRISQWWR
jgi:pyruvate/2-oxoglutarate dehydrogenase complex dihydrolipoamide dehydrogenase (E3) component